MSQVQTVAEAQVALEQAKDAALRQRVEDARKELKQVRQTAKQLRARLAVVTREITERDTRVAALLAERERLDYAIRVRTSPNDDILFDPGDYEEEVEDLKAHRQKIIEKMHAANQRGASRTEAVSINNELIRLQFVARNLVNVIENRGKIVNYQGGVASIS